MTRNQCWASKPHVPVSDRGMSSDKMIQKWSKQQIRDWWGEDAITSHRSMSIQMFPCGSLSACLIKPFIVKVGHALMLLSIKRIGKKKGGVGNVHILSFTTYFKMFARALWLLHTSAGHCVPWYWVQSLCFPLPWGNRLSKTPLWEQLWISAWENPQG